MNSANLETELFGLKYIKNALEKKIERNFDRYSLMSGGFVRFMKEIGCVYHNSTSIHIYLRKQDFRDK